MQLKNKPFRFKVQWHLTDRCNLSCTHCYQDGGPCCDPGFDHLLAVYEKIRDLFFHFRNAYSGNTRFHLSLTGGEPLIRSDFFSLLDHIRPDRSMFRLSILTNGTLIDRDLARRLKSYGPTFVQVSVDGTEPVHDAIRGAGTHRMACAAARHLVREKIPVSFAFTVHRENRHCFSRVVRLAGKIGVRTVWADRMIPQGRAGDHQLSRLNAKELRLFNKDMVRAGRSCERSLFSKTRVSMHRALQFFEAGGRPYHCQAGCHLLAIGSDGTVYPCRRMPEPLGRLPQDSLVRIYHDHAFLHKLRDEKNIPEACASCFYAQLCRGGLRCLSYAVYGDPLVKDPDCPLA